MLVRILPSSHSLLSSIPLKSKNDKRSELQLKKKKWKKILVKINTIL